MAIAFLCLRTVCQCSTNGALLKAASLASMIAGWTVIDLSQVRVSMIMLLICFAAFFGLLFFRGERVRLRTIIVALPLGALLSLGLAIGMVAPL